PVDRRRDGERRAPRGVRRSGCSGALAVCVARVPIDPHRARAHLRRERASLLSDAMNRTKLLAVLALLALLFVTRSARAHAVGMSRGEYVASGDLVHARIVFAGPELATALPLLDADGDGALSAAEVQHGSAVLDHRIVQNTHVSVGEACAPRFESAS